MQAIGSLREVELELIDIAPAPILAGFKRPDDGMLCGVEVFGGMLVFRRVAASHVPTGEAQPQVDPSVS